MEIWKDVVGYEGLYQVSNYGRVKSLERKINNRIYEERIISQEKSKDGYLRVDLHKDGNRKHKKVHRLVAQSFLEDYQESKCINHKDENKHNNFLNNLEICDYSYNINYGSRNKKVSEKLSKKINQYDLDGNFIKTWDSMTQINKETGICLSNIFLCCRNKIKNCNGFIFKYFTKQ